MARNKRRSGLGEDEPGLDISSLIDVCFLLLIYFIVSTSIKAMEQDVNMKLPSPGKPSSDLPEIQPFFIKIDAGGIIYTGAAPNTEQLDSDPDDRDVPLLSQRLEGYKQGCDLAGNEPVVQVKISGDAMQQRALDVLNSISKFGITTVTFTDLVD